MGAEEPLHRRSVQSPINLRPRAADGGALRAVQEAKLNPRRVGCARHQPVQGVDFPNEVTLAETGR